jgi:hypothetical protein
MARAKTAPSAEELKAIHQRVVPVSDMSPYVKACVFGVNGSGKTRFGASGPKAILLDINQEGTRSVLHSGAKAFQAATWEDIGQFYWYIKALHERDRCPYKTLVIDDCQGMYDAAMDLVLAESEERDPAKEKSSPRRQDYGRANKLFTIMALAIRNLPMHVVFISQEKKIRDEDTKEVVDVTLRLSEGARGGITDAVGIIGRMSSREVIRRDESGKKKRVWVDLMDTRPSDVIVTKDRTNQLGLLQGPTMEKVIKAWMNGNYEETDNG